MLHTRLCEILEIEHPIISAPMAGTAGAELAAAVSEAGGFGLIGVMPTEDPSRLRDQIREARHLTNRPFGVGFITSFPGIEAFVEIALDEGVAAVSHSFADPGPYVERAHQAGALVLAQVQKVSHAIKAADAGVDVIAAQGVSAGGHTGHSGTVPLTLSVIDGVGGIPVVAAGGIADGRGLAAALVLGAEGVWMGTRFVASHEARAAGWMKQQAVAAGADDTVLTRVFDLAWDAPFPEDVSDRVLRNEFTDEWHGREEALIDDREAVRHELIAAYRSDDRKRVANRVGNAIGQISSTEPAGEIVARIVAQAEEILRSRPGIVLRR